MGEDFSEHPSDAGARLRAPCIPINIPADPGDGRDAAAVKEDVMQSFGDGRSSNARVISPASRYVHPQAVVDDAALTHQQKRSILAHWASDACAVESHPALRLAPGSLRPVKVGDIFVALARARRSDAAPAWRAAQRRPLPEAALMPMPAMAMAGA